MDCNQKGCLGARHMVYAHLEEPSLHWITLNVYRLYNILIVISVITSVRLVVWRVGVGDSCCRTRSGLVPLSSWKMSAPVLYAILYTVQVLVTLPVPDTLAYDTRDGLEVAETVFNVIFLLEIVVSAKHSTWCSLDPSGAPEALPGLDLTCGTQSWEHY